MPHDQVNVPLQSHSEFPEPVASAPTPDSPVWIGYDEGRFDFSALNMVRPADPWEPTWRSPGAYEFDRSDFADGPMPDFMMPPPPRQDEGRLPLSVWVIAGLYLGSVIVGALALTGFFR